MDGSGYGPDIESDLYNFNIFLPNAEIDSRLRRGPNGRPANEKLIRLRLEEPHPLLNTARVDSAYMEDYVNKTLVAQDDHDVWMVLKSRLLVDQDEKTSAEDVEFSNIQPLVNSLKTPKPALYFGAPINTIDAKIQQDLTAFIVPNLSYSCPVLPNLLVIVSGKTEDREIVTRQASYYGAIAARGVHILRDYNSMYGERVYDNVASVLSVVFYGDKLQVYSHFASRPVYHPDYGVYNMTKLYEIDMFDRSDHLQGAKIFRNAIDWAAEQRETLIQQAHSLIIPSSPTGSSSPEIIEISPFSPAKPRNLKRRFDQMHYYHEQEEEDAGGYYKEHTWPFRNSQGEADFDEIYYVDASKPYKPKPNRARSSSSCQAQ